MASNVKEIAGSAKTAAGTVKANAVRKAERAAKEARGAVVIGADTLVVKGNMILGKPRNEGEAKRMLKGFSGKEIDVYTGICVIDTAKNKKAVGTDKSAVGFDQFPMGVLGSVGRRL